MSVKGAHPASHVPAEKRGQRSPFLCPHTAPIIPRAVSTLHPHPVSPPTWVWLVPWSWCLNSSPQSLIPISGLPHVWPADPSSKTLLGAHPLLLSSLSGSPLLFQSRSPLGVSCPTGTVVPARNIDVQSLRRAEGDPGDRALLSWGMDSHQIEGICPWGCLAWGLQPAEAMGPIYPGFTASIPTPPGGQVRGARRDAERRRDVRQGLGEPLCSYHKESCLNLPSHNQGNTRPWWNPFWKLLVLVGTAGSSLLEPASGSLHLVPSVLWEVVVLELEQLYGSDLKPTHHMQFLWHGPFLHISRLFSISETGISQPPLGVVGKIDERLWEGSGWHVLMESLPMNCNSKQ